MNSKPLCFDVVRNDSFSADIIILNGCTDKMEIISVQVFFSVVTQYSVICISKEYLASASL